MVVAAGSLLLGGLFIRFYDLLHQAVAHDVLLCQANLRDALDVPQDMQGIHEAGGLEAVRMREKEEAVLIQLGLPRTVSYTSDEI